MNGSSERTRVAVVGASGYTGAELLRLLHGHPRVAIAALVAERRAGLPIGDVFPQLGGFGLPDLVALDAVDWNTVDVAFCCLPHGTTQEVVLGLPRALKVIDLSADFRLADTALYAEWYGHPHYAPALQGEAAYGLTELDRAAIKASRLIAVPGCFPTAALLPLAPLIEARAIDADDVVIDAKTGVTGAGRAAKEGMLYAEVAEGMHAYGIAGHRHGPEIEQQLSTLAGRPLRVSFTPHLAPMNRGILATIYVRPAAGIDAERLRAILAERYASEPFVRVLPAGKAPATRHVRGSNRCDIGVFADRIADRAIVIAAIDNLIKGASGQALQNMNAMLDLPEITGLDLVAMFP